MIRYCVFPARVGVFRSAMLSKLEEATGSVRTGFDVAKGRFPENAVSFILPTGINYTFQKTKGLP